MIGSVAWTLGIGNFLECSLGPTVSRPCQRRDPHGLVPVFCELARAGLAPPTAPASNFLSSQRSSGCNVLAPQSDFETWSFCFDIKRVKTLGSRRSEEAFVCGGECDGFSQRRLEADRRSQMDGVETPEGVTLDQIAGQNENFVLQVQTNVGLPVALKLSAGQGILTARQMAFTVFPRQTCIDLGIGNLRCRHMAPLADKGLNLGRPLFDHEPLDERAGVQLVHRLSSRMVREIGGPETRTLRTLLRGFRLGRVRSP